MGRSLHAAGSSRPDAARLRRAAPHRRALHQPRAPGQTLQATALVNEAFVRLAAERPREFNADALPRHRRALDAADPRAARPGAARAQARRAPERVTLDDARGGAGQDSARVRAARPGPAQRRRRPRARRGASQLAELDAASARIVELRYFGGLTVEETAEAVGVSPATVKRQWAMARAWLKRALEGGRASRETTPRRDA